MPSGYYRSALDIPGTWPTDTTINQTLYVHNTFSVTASGTYTYYLVGQMTSGQDAGDYFWYAHMRGVYHPYPTVRQSFTADEIALMKEKELEQLR